MQRLEVQSITLGLAIALPVAVVVFVFAPELLRLVLGPEYESAATPTRILVWFLPLAVIQAPILGELAATGHASDTSKVFLATFLVALAGHALLDPWAGAPGAAAASLMRDFVAVPIAVLLLRKRRMHPPDACEMHRRDHVALSSTANPVDEASYA